MRVNEGRIRNTHEVLTSLDELMIAALDVETGSRGYVLTGEEQYLEPYRTGIAEALEDLATLETLTDNNAVQSDNLDRLRTLVEEKICLSQLAIRHAGTAASNRRLR